MSEKIEYTITIEQVYVPYLDPESSYYEWWVKEDVGDETYPHSFEAYELRDECHICESEDEAADYVEERVAEIVEEWDFEKEAIKIEWK